LGIKKALPPFGSRAVESVGWLLSLALLRAYPKNQVRQSGGFLDGRQWKHDTQRRYRSAVHRGL